jgi:hypothetical protein
MSQVDQALAFLLSEGVRWYTNEERKAAPCPTCQATGEAPCTGYGGRKRDEPHADRPTLAVPRSQDEQDELIMKLARRYAGGWRTQASPWHREPRRYPR